MADTLKLSILTPEKELYKGEVTEIVTTAENGTIGILANHMPLITPLKPCETKIKTSDGKELVAFTSLGILEVNKDGDVHILCEAAEWPEEIDVERAKEAEKRAKARLENKSGETDIKRAEMALQRALIRIKVKQD